ncbi:MAG: GNAT family N-acetyltransferase [Pseudomonadota bacterium]
MTVEIRPDDLQDPRVMALIAAHRAHSHAHSPATSAHTLTAQALRAPGITLYVAWEGEAALATGALQLIDPAEGAEGAEIKSMHVAEAARGRGLGAAMLAHLEAAARARELGRLWLETGSMDAYAPARGLYARHGFTPCPPFGTYVEDANSVFMTKPLSGPAAAAAGR